MRRHKFARHTGRTSSSIRSDLDSRYTEVWTLRFPFSEQIRFKAAFWEAALGVMDRLVLSDAAWERMAPLIIGRPDQKGTTGRDNRMFVEGVLWIARTGSPWRDLPEASTVRIADAFKTIASAASWCGCLAWPLSPCHRTQRPRAGRVAATLAFIKAEIDLNDAGVDRSPSCLEFHITDHHRTGLWINFPMPKRRRVLLNVKINATMLHGKLDHRNGAETARGAQISGFSCLDRQRSCLKRLKVNRGADQQPLFVRLC
jgi:Putative transposase of IS4/5 family (DUF4096)